MRIIKRFDRFSINENLNVISCKASNLTGEVTLYRLTSHPVVNLSEPGEYYVCDVESINPDLLDNKDGNLFLITVKTIAENIDIERSNQECIRLGEDSIVAVKSDSACEVESVTPYK